MRYVDASIQTIDGAHTVDDTTVDVSDAGEFFAPGVVKVWDAADASVLKAVISFTGITTNQLTGCVWDYGGHVDVNVADGDFVAQEFPAGNVRSELLADDLPPTPNALDDEFDNVTIGGWTAQHLGTAPTWTERADSHLYLAADSESGNFWKTQVKSIPAGDWDIRCKVTSMTSKDAQYPIPSAMILAEGTTGQALTGYGLLLNASAKMLASVENYTDYDSYASTSASVAWWNAHPVYYRLTRATATYAFSISSDGQQWIQVHSGTLGYTPTLIGVGGNPFSSPIGAAFDWFRRIS